ncbi:hypothetical protein C8P68_101650 [Mucilaginibacter yixingensis]|uniref:5'-nucleotidase n=1 Tax=Mucilaginibacter yixingensis TaxID=1295612 RepID=A0A2T5JGC4_9SPHI|nr:hypothetical protein [Mucilaginibacter yixingensis]PTR01416.1 hypothetical protein C8P68_101650 [Mucilaginibacter yixingensis]
MNHTRRIFLSQFSLITGAALLHKSLANAAIINQPGSGTPSQLNVYCSNDLQGQIESVYKEMGGLSLIKKKMQNEQTEGLLLDAGGFINPAQSLAHQQKMIGMMNSIGYHAAGLSGHELQAGADYLVNLAADMKFNLVNCNHHFSGPLAAIVKPYIIININGVKTGITGVCSPITGVAHTEVMGAANRAARHLKERERCQWVICLAHLDSDDKADSHQLAKQSSHIDMIVAGNNARLSTNINVAFNKLSHEVILTQGARYGLMFSRTIIGFDGNGLKNSIAAKQFIPGVDGVQAFAASYQQLRGEQDQLLSA